MKKYKNNSKNVLTNDGEIDIIKSTKENKQKQATPEERSLKYTNEI